MDLELQTVRNIVSTITQFTANSHVHSSRIPSKSIGKANKRSLTHLQVADLVQFEGPPERRHSTAATSINLISHQYIITSNLAHMTGYDDAMMTLIIEFAETTGP